MGVQASSGRTEFGTEGSPAALQHWPAKLNIFLQLLTKGEKNDNNLTHTPLIHHHPLSWLLENDFWWKSGDVLQPLQAPRWQFHSIYFRFLWVFLLYLQMHLSLGWDLSDLFRSHEIGYYTPLQPCTAFYGASNGKKLHSEEGTEGRGGNAENTCAWIDEKLGVGCVKKTAYLVMLLQPKHYYGNIKSIPVIQMAWKRLFLQAECLQNAAVDGWKLMVYWATKLHSKKMTVRLDWNVDLYTKKGCGRYLLAPQKTTEHLPMGIFCIEMEA